ncbi:unnamed protein product [Owenia fusiformis]|uniref:Regucalcin n=1 Tax=Owenia fusiformis TaxID=6347 RepID=A0A8S4N3T8_OWEFU|nr:unnamed protein product [Owenia fusiformis]
MSYKVEVVPGLEKVAKTVGEGPHWDDASQTLMFVDIMEGTIIWWDYKTGAIVNRYKTDEGPVTLVVPRRSGGYVISTGRKLNHLQADRTTVTPLAEEVDQGTQNRFNDGKCDPKGRLWAGTMGHEPVPTQLELEMGSLYRLDLEGQLTKWVEKVSISNGLAWDLEKSTMYYIDSIPKVVYAFDYDNKTGDISNRRTAIDYSKCLESGDPKELGVPDGMCIDTEGKLWVACFFGARVIRFDPQTGKMLQTIPIPAARVTSCCFGGPNMDILYVTCSAFQVDENEWKKYPSTGSVFQVTGLGVKGCTANVYEG